MNFEQIFYALILLAWGEIMYKRGQRDMGVIIKKANETAKRLLEEGNEDEEN